MGPKTLQKLQKWETEIFTASTFGDVVTCCAIMLWCFRILQQPLASLYWLLKYLRRRGRTLQSYEDPPNLWPCLTRTIKQAISWCRCSRFFPKSATDYNDAPHCTIFTDACQSGWGAIVVLSGDSTHGWLDETCVTGVVGLPRVGRRVRGRKFSLDPLLTTLQQTDKFVPVALNS